MYVADIYSSSFGCDPEIFLTTEVPGEGLVVLPSNVIVPEEGIRLGDQRIIVRDGVQVELHPWSESCRANIGNTIQTILAELNRKLADRPDIKVSMMSSVKLSKENLAMMPPAARQFGCMPSKNAYGRRHVQRNGDIFPWRFGGGHIHVGYKTYGMQGIFGPSDKPKQYYDYLVENTDNAQLARVFDVLVGLPCVLLDRDENAAERRKSYGRAGEYREPAHGFEYRTLSNFWMRNYKLMSLVFGMAYNALNVYPALMPQPPQELIDSYNKMYTIYGYKYGHNRAWTVYDPSLELSTRTRALMEKIPMDIVEETINTNDFNTAKQLFDEFVRDYLRDLGTIKGLYGVYGLRTFDAIVSTGITKFFPEDPMTHWLNKQEGHNTGWEALTENFDPARHAQVTDVRLWAEDEYREDDEDDWDWDGPDEADELTF